MPYILYTACQYNICLISYTHLVNIILRINKFLEISPSTAFKARAVTGRWLCLLRCYISGWTLYRFSACTVTLQNPIDNFVVSDYYLNGQTVYLFTSMYVSPAHTYTYKSCVSCIPDKSPILVQVYYIITGLAQHSQAAADTIICLWQHVSETPSTVKFQGIYLCVIHALYLIHSLSI